MPYDLYGTYYSSYREACNAEDAQCAAISADLAYREVQQLKQQIEHQRQPQPDEEISHLWHCYQQLELRISTIERKVVKKPSKLMPYRFPKL